MARQVSISNEEIQRAKQLCDQTISIADYRKSLSVILVAELGLTADHLLARHGWRKVQPDTKHPKSDPALPDDFKKTPRSSGCRLLEKCRSSS